MVGCGAPRTQSHSVIGRYLAAEKGAIGGHDWSAEGGRSQRRTRIEKILGSRRAHASWYIFDLSPVLSQRCDDKHERRWSGFHLRQTTKWAMADVPCVR